MLTLNYISSCRRRWWTCLSFCQLAMTSRFYGFVSWATTRRRVCMYRLRTRWSLISGNQVKSIKVWPKMPVRLAILRLSTSMVTTWIATWSQAKSHCPCNQNSARFCKPTSATLMRNSKIRHWLKRRVISPRRLRFLLGRLNFIPIKLAYSQTWLVRPSLIMPWSIGALIWLPTKR